MKTIKNVTQVLVVATLALGFYSFAIPQSTQPVLSSPYIVTDEKQVVEDSMQGVVKVIRYKADTPDEIEGFGTGVFVDDNTIITNNHVVSKAGKIRVAGRAWKTFPAIVISSDPVSDLALVKIGKNGPQQNPDSSWDNFKKLNNGFKVIQLADLNKTNDGDPVFVIGHPWGLDFSVSRGIISYKQRRIPDGSPLFYVQTDAHLFNGNSGGPIIDYDGRLVAISDMMYSPHMTNSENGGSYGLGIPASIIQKLLPDLKANKPISWAALGVTFHTPNDDEDYATVESIAQHSAADNAGVKLNDQLVAIAPVDTQGVVGEFVSTADAEVLQNFLALQQAGSTIALKIIRNHEEKIINVITDSRPASFYVQVLQELENEHQDQPGDLNPQKLTPIHPKKHKSK